MFNTKDMASEINVVSPSNTQRKKFPGKQKSQGTGTETTMSLVIQRNKDHYG